MLSNTKNAPHPRRRENKEMMFMNNSIIAFLNKKTSDGDPYWAVGLFMFGLLTILMQGANIVAPLYWLGLISL